MKKNSLNKVDLFGISFRTATLSQGIAAVEEMIQSRVPQLLVLANVHTLNLAYEQNDYKTVLKNTGLVLRDGTGVSWAIKRKGVPPLHNFVGTDFIPEFCKRTAHKGYRIFLLGSREGIAQMAAEKLKLMAPGLIIAGHHHGYFPEEKTHDIVSRINETQSHILLVAMGNPKQEFWIANNLNILNVPVCIGVGALFDYLSGNVKRAPKWVLDKGMEWSYRLMVEPKRLWRRYLIGNPKFMLRIVSSKKYISQP